MFQTHVEQKIETHILCSIAFFSKNRIGYKITETNMVRWTGHRQQYGAWTLHDG